MNAHQFLNQFMNWCAKREPLGKCTEFLREWVAIHLIGIAQTNVWSLLFAKIKPRTPLINKTKFRISNYKYLQDFDVNSLNSEKIDNNLSAKFTLARFLKLHLFSHAFIHFFEIIICLPNQNNVIKNFRILDLEFESEKNLNLEIGIFVYVGKIQFTPKKGKWILKKET